MNAPGRGVGKRARSLQRPRDMDALLDSLNRFVVEHQPCGPLTLEMPEPPAGARYVLRVTCACSTTFEARVTIEEPPERAAYSRLMASLN